MTDGIGRHPGQKTYLDMTMGTYLAVAALSDDTALLRVGKGPVVELNPEQRADLVAYLTSGRS